MSRQKKTSRQNAYIGKAGQLAVMAEFALLGYNVSLPEIDKGDDVYVVNELSGKLWRVQVKCATVQKGRGDGYQVMILESQIRKAPREGAPDLHFVFALRQELRWRFIVMSRARLEQYINDRAMNGKEFGCLNKKSQRRTLSITFLKNRPDDVSCSRENWNDYLDKWSEWPEIDHEEAVADHKEYSTDTTNSEVLPTTTQAGIRLSQAG